jgi:hypothetical protein
LPRSILGQDPANICNFQKKEGNTSLFKKRRKHLAFQKAKETPRFSKSEEKTSLLQKARTIESIIFHTTNIEELLMSYLMLQRFARIASI